MCINVCKWKLDKSKINIRTEHSHILSSSESIFHYPFLLSFCSAIFQLQSLVFNWTISRISFQNSLFSKLIGRKGPFCSTFFFMINFALIWRYLKEMHLNEKWSKFACQFEGVQFSLFACICIDVKLYLLKFHRYWNLFEFIGIYWKIAIVEWQNASFMASL